MSLPRELLDQLLTGYLDDALSSDERARVEQLLQSNPEIVDELAQLRVLRQSLKAVLRADSDIKLEKGFADRVLGAAVARARAEGLGDDHPLVRLAEQPSTTRTATRSSSWQAAAVLVGLAASIVIAVVALRPEPGPVIAELERPAPLPDPAVNPLVVPDVAADVLNAVEPDKLATSDPVSPSPDSPTNVSPTNDDPVVQPESTGAPMKRQPSLLDAIAQSQDRGADSVEAPTVTKIEIPQTRLGMVLVVDVRHTAAGRRTNAVRQAMKRASLEPTSEKEVTDQITGIVSDATSPLTDGDEVSVLYLQSTAKKLDQFYLQLQRDVEGIESVRLAITTDAPIMNAVKAVSPDPKMVRHQDASLELFSATGVVDEFAQRLGQLQYGPNSRNGVNMMPSNGPDVPAQILVLVR